LQAYFAFDTLLCLYKTLLGYRDQTPRLMVGGDFVGFAELLVSMQDALDRTELNVPPPLSPALETFSPLRLDGTLVIDGSNEMNKEVGSMKKGQCIYAWMFGFRLHWGPWQLMRPTRNVILGHLTLKPLR